MSKRKYANIISEIDVHVNSDRCLSGSLDCRVIASTIDFTLADSWKQIWLNYYFLSNWFLSLLVLFHFITLNTVSVNNNNNHKQQTCNVNVYAEYCKYTSGLSHCNKQVQISFMESLV